MEEKVVTLSGFEYKGNLVLINYGKMRHTRGQHKKWVEKDGGQETT